ncbi:hypothetical protein GCM10023322_22860 [Rugosimonospora acidiphila]|uniref:Uncharacterized protein n=1 Tax=Rugosimonospora acidiphila TaxID=556531 RepID=A0ABP9RR64_9ACTN
MNPGLPAWRPVSRPEGRVVSNHDPVTIAATTQARRGQCRPRRPAPWTDLLPFTGSFSAYCQEVIMAKKSRKKKARRKSAANHGKRPNS